MKNILKYAFFFVTAITTVSCDDYLDVQPIGKVIPETLADYRAVLTRGYEAFPEHKSLITLRTDEMILDDFSNDFVYWKDIYSWNDGNADRITTDFQYDGLYNTIFYANVIINDANGKLAASADKDQLIGEAYALRAYAYFDLLNLFGKPYNPATAATDKGVPLALKVDLEQAYIPETVAKVYEQILSDKEEAKRLLNKDTQAKGLNYRFSKAALYAMESRIFLYQKEWAKAIEASNNALTYKNALVDLNATPVLPTSYDGVESILALEDVFNNNLKGSSYVSSDLLDAYDQVNDLRFGVYFRKSGGDFYFKKGGELAQKCSFRAAELYLTKAESSAQLNDLTTAKTTVLTFIKKRYNAAGYNTLSVEIDAMNQTELLDFIGQERQREFAAEGQRWFDLRRTTQKEITHYVSGDEYILIQNDPRYTLPFPQNARLNNPNL
ncbi:RagB/SusD family nutrient uptake outer membrane protein [Flavobacterium sp. N1736]|uniref:RagB/SusD family nutrient uptake outer membrane protein n=1 Tax=Flavobacterium sp. N1736 TaxID=2986823 RepID=UPI0022244E86|nr:RagB/SusD family nutrient uptake outer membrane protein [Flavobacterium sp. N1736]